MFGALRDPTLDLMHRFIRLWKKLRWAISDLDKTMTALQAADIDQRFLVSVAAVKQLQTALSVPLATVLSFWANLDTDGSDSFYLSLFQNKAVLNPPDPAFQLNYIARLTSPPTLQFPSPMFPSLVYDPTAKTLTALTNISDTELAQLQSLSNDTNLINVLDFPKHFRHQCHRRVGVVDSSHPFRSPPFLRPTCPRGFTTMRPRRRSASRAPCPTASASSSISVAIRPTRRQSTLCTTSARSWARSLWGPLMAFCRAWSYVSTPVPIPPSATTIMVNSPGVIPVVPFVAAIGSEQILVTARFGATLDGDARVQQYDSGAPQRRRPSLLERNHQPRQPDHRRTSD